MAILSSDPRVLVEAHKAGDRAAFDGIVRQYYEGLFAHALRRLGDAHAAEDAVQETLTRAYRALGRFNGQYQLRAWLHRILTNVCHDEGRRRQRESTLVQRAGGSATVEELPADDELERLDVDREQVLNALSALPESYRNALVLRYVDELSFSEVAEATGISEGNARLRVHRGRNALRRALGGAVGSLVWLVPFLRRGQRTAWAATPDPALVASAPTLGRASEAAVALAERGQAFAGLMGVTAALVVPAAVPVVSNGIADAVSPPTPAVAAPAPDEGVEGTDRRALAQLALPASSPPPSSSSSSSSSVATTDDAAPKGDPGGGAAPAPIPTPPAPPPVVAAGTGTDTGPDARIGVAPPAAAPLDEEGPRPSSPPTTRAEDLGAVDTPSPIPASQVAPPSGAAVGSTTTTSTTPPLRPRRSATMSAGDLRAVRTHRVEVSGQASLTLGGQTVVATVSGSMDPPEERSDTPPAPGSEAEVAGSTTTTSSPSATPTSTPSGSAGGSAPPAASRPERLTAQLRLALDGGTVVDLVLDAEATRGDDGGLDLRGAFVLSDICRTEIGRGDFVGSVHLEELPLASSLDLRLATFAADLASLRRSSTDC